MEGGDHSFIIGPNSANGIFSGQITMIKLDLFAAKITIDLFYCGQIILYLYRIYLFCLKYQIWPKINQII
jgi:hypothetical protein